MKKKIQYWILPIWGSVEPQKLIGPFKTYKGLLKRATVEFENQSDEDALFYMVTGESVAPRVEVFSGSELS